jgi:hypothetical protein
MSLAELDQEYDRGYTRDVKTAVSIPDDVFDRASRHARKLGISRSELFTRALRDFLNEHQEREIRASYDRAFGPGSGEDDTAAFRRHGARTALRDVEW